MTFGEKMKEARKRAGLSQEQFAEKMSVSRSAVAKWESDRGMPDVNNLKVMKDAPKKQPETTPTTENPTKPDNPTNPTTPSTETPKKETPKKETPTTPKTGDDRNPLIWLRLFGIGGCMAGSAWYLRKKDEKDQNQD